MPSATSERCRALGRDLVQQVRDHGVDRAALAADPLGDRVAGALADLAAVEVDARHPGLRREGDELHALDAPRPQAELLLGEDDDRAALGRLVGERGELRRLGEVARQDVRRRDRSRSPGGCRA